MAVRKDHLGRDLTTLIVGNKADTYGHLGSMYRSPLAAQVGGRKYENAEAAFQAQKFLEGNGSRCPGGQD